MSTLIQIRDLSHSLGSKPLFQQLNLTINQGDSIGLVGYNGAGKSTLLALLADQMEPDEGTIDHSRELRLEKVEQFIPADLMHLTLLSAVTQKTTAADDQQADDYRAPMILHQLGFTEKEHDFRVSDLSGGQQNRLMFARAMINEPNMVLFDEPTNHLDLHTILYFENFLQQMRAGFILVSHDRDFLDAVTNRTLFLRDDGLQSFQLPYSQAASRLQEADLAAAMRRNAEEKSIARIRASAKRLAIWGKVYDNEKLARKAKSMEKRAAKLDEEKTQVSRGSGLSLNMSVGQSRSNRMLQIEGLSVLPPMESGSSLFDIEQLTIRPGERLALLGDNGSGKTSLITHIMQAYRNKDQESIKLSPQCKIGYYDQELLTLSPHLSLLDTLRKECDANESQMVSSLIKAGFPYKDHSKRISFLSGGEKARLVFLILQLNAPNFLILDEPTNHIDIQGKEELESQLLESNATLLITSHDRRFINTLASRFVLIRDGRLREINHPDEFWLAGPNRHKAEEKSPVAANESKVDDSSSQDELLTRLVELEEKLTADRKRKKKHQKPALQSEWEAEIAVLTKIIDA